MLGRRFTHHSVAMMAAPAMLVVVVLAAAVSAAAVSAAAVSAVVSVAVLSAVVALSAVGLVTAADRPPMRISHKPPRLCRSRAHHCPV
jgi:hypothetical protein